MEQVDRLPGCIALKPIIYGNSAERLSQKTAQEHTHKWRLFVRPYCEEDISKYIKKVQFRLHDSYTNPIRTIESPPFEVEETGWGEFEAGIKIFFVDTNEKPVNAVYYLRLFLPAVTMPDGKQIVLYEHYDEIIFVEPTKAMMRALEEGSRDKPLKSVTDFQQQKNHLVDKLNNAIKEVTAEISDLRESLRQNCFQSESKIANSSRGTSVDGSVDSSMDH